MSKGIAWITTTWINQVKKLDSLLRPLSEEAGLEIRLDAKGVPLTEEEVIEGLPDVVAVLPSNDVYSERVFSRAKDLRIIARTGVGVNAIDLDAAAASGVVVTNAVGQNAESVAEHTFGLMLGIARKIPWMDKNVRRGEWVDVRCLASSLKGKTLGIIGLGNIGKQVARRAAAFGMEILAHDIVRDERFAAEVGVYFHPLEKVVRKADYLTCHVPLTPETKGLIGPDLIRLMHPGAFLINTSRGPVVDLDALSEALSSGLIQGAAIDVFPSEPPDASHPLFSHENVIVTPHAAGLADDASENCLRHAVQATIDLLAGRIPSDIVNPRVLEKLPHLH